MLPRAALLLPAALLLAACPQRVEESKADKPKAELTAEDPRVVADTSDLYPAKPDDAPKQTGLGSGVPDETNGECRLYAPKLPSPECCPQDLGINARQATAACGHTLYLGESYQMTCGYFFASEETTDQPKWLRLSYTLENEIEAAVKAHDERISIRVAMDPDFHSEPVPGVDGAFWSAHDNLRWAFLPGWAKPRQLTWRDDSCDDEGIKKVMRALIAAPEPAAGSPRTNLIPGEPAAPAEAAG